MTELTLQLPDAILERLESEAQRQKTPLSDVVLTAIERYLDDDEPTKEEILDSLRQSMQDALAGRVRPVEEILAELRQEFDFDDDNG